VTFVIRDVLPAEHDELGELIARAYLALGDDGAPDGYEDELRDVSGRAAVCPVLVAIDDDDTVLGGATYVPGPDNPMCEHRVEDAASIRMMAVRPEARGRGVASALTRACLDRARSEGRRWLVLHSSAPMADAQRLYLALGFERDPEIDWRPSPNVDLRAYRYDLRRQA
jgi:ribosomal protein S18 acetylase RimI-like enzyme